MAIIDFHTHAFPDALAPRAIATLEGEIEDRYAAKLDGRADSLLASMDAAGIRRAVVCPIATKPRQFEGILEWSLSIRSDRLIPLGSIHPDAADVAAEVRRVAEAGLIGLKLHPMYQQFTVDEPRLDPLYAAAAETGLMVVLHSGYDIAFDDSEQANAQRIAAVIDRHPDLLLVATHLGGWKDWRRVREFLAPRKLWIGTSYSLDWMSREDAVDLIRTLGVDRLLFGTDSPWADQREEIARMKALGLTDAEYDAIFSGNAERLLGSLGA
ncbi:MAG: amidohydrolase family protein [Planctomycetota bacterium]